MWAYDLVWNIVNCFLLWHPHINDKNFFFNTYSVVFDIILFCQIELPSVSMDLILASSQRIFTVQRAQWDDNFSSNVISSSILANLFSGVVS